MIFKIYYIIFDKIVLYCARYYNANNIENIRKRYNIFYPLHIIKFKKL